VAKYGSDTWSWSHKDKTIEIAELRLGERPLTGYTWLYTKEIQTYMKSYSW
jgi:hypothetical protein